MLLTRHGGTPAPAHCDGLHLSVSPKKKKKKNQSNATNQVDSSLEVRYEQIPPYLEMHE